VIIVLMEKLPRDEDLNLPTYATAGSVGVDLSAAISNNKTLLPGERILIPTSFAIAVPEHYKALIRSRSVLGLKHKLLILIALAPLTKIIGERSK
jgi:dUTP pyrophosphatase